MMDRNRLYATNAERQKAYRQRLAATHPAAPMVQATPFKRKRALSRPERIDQALTEVQALAAEYEEWLQALPEQFQEGALADKLSDTVEKLNAAADLLGEIDAPKGFGRD